MFKRWPELLLLLLWGLGAYLRLSQYSSQVLLDDEWHAVHQLMSGKTPGELFRTLGLADYSIPLGLYYYWYAANWGLSELAMRAPMLLASLMALPLFSLYVWRQFSLRISLAFTLLLALSPMLVIYAHTARPYALTLLLSYLGLWVFYQFWRGTAKWWLGAGYASCTALCIWLHLITGPFMAAPLVLEGIRALWQRNWRGLLRLVLLGAVTAMVTAALVLPPLLADYQSLASKSGLAEIDWQTAWGVWFVWLGNGWWPLVSLLLLLAGLGLPRLLRQPLLQAALLGVLLTLALVLISQPASVQHPLTMGRYLLQIIPALLLAVVLGLMTLPGRLRWLSLGLVLPACVVTSPSWQLTLSPTNQMTHSLLQFDFRPAHNRVEDYMQAIPLSPFWDKFGDERADSLQLAVAPFYFETYNWDAPRWEQHSGQRVVPALLLSYCAKKRWGEVPADDRFRFRNVFHLSQLDTPGTVLPDWLVYTLPFTGYARNKENQQVGGHLERCLRRLRRQLGPADYEDAMLVAWRLTGAESAISQ